MAYIIAHGTVNGYQKIQSTLSDNRELQILTDIRTEFDNTSSMLTKSEGYLLQMSPSGVWISIVKTLMDGERSGGGAGFFAFSAFIPKEQMIAGQQLKKVLDKLMQHYLSLCPNFMTRNINVDWSFVTNASAELNALCQPRCKAINTYYVPAEQFAYVPITTNEEQIQYLDKPFQPEYGAYKAVFIGTHLQHPMGLPQQTCLNIELENEVFDIVWSGNTQGWNNLPKTVRKNEIVTGSYTFTRKYYHPYPVKYSDGTINKADATLTLKVPTLLPEIHQITLRYNYPEAVERVMALAQSRTIYAKTIPNVLEFSGEEFATQFKIHLFLKDGYRCNDIVLTPCDCPNNICHITTITKMQLISLQILNKGNNETQSWHQSIDVKNKKTFEKLTKEFEHNTLSFLIQEDENFIQNYEVSLRGDGYSIGKPQLISGSLYHISISKNEHPLTLTKESNKRKVDLELPNHLDLKKLSATINGRNISIDTHSNFILINKQEHRQDVKFSCNGVALKSKNKGNDKIKLTLTLWGLIKLNVRAILLVACIGLLLFLLVVGTLMLFRGFDLKKLIIIDVETECFDPDRVDNGTPATPTTDTKTITEDQRLYNELDSILKIQRKIWQYETINNIRDHYDKTPVTNPEHKANKLYKELVWMQCRKRLDGYWLDDTNGKWTPYINYKAHNKQGRLINSWIFGINKYGINSNNSIYATSELLEFLKEIVAAPDAKQKQFFEQYVRNKKVEKMTFPDVKRLWDNFTPTPNDRNSNEKNQQEESNPSQNNNLKLNAD